MKYKAGDRVRIVGVRTPGMNPNGEMDRYLDTVMTIEYIIVNSSYRMREDPGWVWSDNDILCLEEEYGTKARTLDSLEPFETTIEDNIKYKRFPSGFLAVKGESMVFIPDKSIE